MLSVASSFFAENYHKHAKQAGQLDKLDRYDGENVVR